LSNAYYIRIQAIEKHAKVKLFDRDRSGVHVIAVGCDFVERATVLLVTPKMSSGCSSARPRAARLSRQDYW